MLQLFKDVPSTLIDAILIYGVFVIIPSIFKRKISVKWNNKSFAINEEVKE